VPPIFQPEVAARAILFAAQSRRREIWVGMPTVKAILVNRIAPGLLDHYLARTGYDGQMTQEPADPEAPDNLFSPLPRDHGAHGRFDERATDGSAQLCATRHRRALTIGTALLATGLGVAWWARRSTAGAQNQ
jgi:hypothetical protein